jgi:hypothetical protein
MVLFEVAKGMVTGDRPDIGEMHWLELDGDAGN